MGSKIIRIFVATDQRMGKSDVALAASIRKNVSPPYEIHWLRSGSPGYTVGSSEEFERGEVDWNIGRPSGRPYSPVGWATDFTCFRFVIPELCRFRGRAIYMDTDFLALRDLRPLWELELDGHAAASPGGRTDLMLMDCSRFSPDWWPSIGQLRSGEKAHSIGHLRTILLGRGEMLKLPSDGTWESWDGAFLSKETTCLHFTNMRTQPWKPYPEVFTYPERHPIASLDDLFWEYYELGRAYADKKLEGIFRDCKSQANNMQLFMDRLRELGSECGTVCEFGVETGKSSVALMLGSNNLHSWDLVRTKRAKQLEDLAPHYWTFRIGDSRTVDIPECDLLFIDSSHNGPHLTEELERHHYKVRRWIALHDTVSCGADGNGTRNWSYKILERGLPGLLGAVDAFVGDHPFSVVENDTRGPGFMLLERDKGR